MSDSKEAKYHPCNVCGADAIACLSPDLDIKGLCYCKKHKEEVQMVYMSIGSVAPSVIDSLIKDWKFK